MAVEPCEMIKTIMDEAFNSFLSDQVRGMNDVFSRNIFSTSVNNLITFVKENHPNAEDMGKVCLTAVERENISTTSNSKETEVWVPSEGSFQPISGSTSKTSDTDSTEGSSYASGAQPTEEPSEANSMLGVRRARSTLYAIHNLVAESSSSSSIDTTTSKVKLTSRTMTGVDILPKDIFYIPEENSTVAHREQLDMVMNRTDIISLHSEMHANLLKEPSALQAWTLSALPTTVSVFYDAKQQNVSQAFNRQTGFEGKALITTNQNVSARSLLYNVTAMVLWMHDEEVSKTKTIKLMEHVAAFIFNGMRSQHVEGGDFNVSGIFMPFYYQRFREWTNSSAHGEPSVFHPDDIAAVYNTLLDPLLHFSAAGKLNTMWMLPMDYRIFYIDLASSLFNPFLLRTLKWRHELRKVSSVSSLSEELSRLMPTPKPSLWRWAAARWRKAWGGTDSGGTSMMETDTMRTVALQAYCNTNVGFLYYDNVVYDFDDQHCCAIPCAVAETTDGVDVPMEECCSNCNLYSCPFDDVEWLQTVQTVMVESYGWYGTDDPHRVIV